MARTPRAPPRDAADFGPALLLNRGQRKVAVVTDSFNPNRTVRRARNFVVYDEWFYRKEITQPQREAADRLAVQWEVVQGASGDGQPGQRGGARSHPPIRMLQAAQDLREAEAALGRVDWGLLCMVVVHNCSRYSARLTGGRLQRLVVLWGME